MLAQDIYLRSPKWAQDVLLNAHAFRIERHRYGSRFRRVLADLRRSEHWTPDMMRQYQDERLRSIVAHAYRDSAYYRSVMQTAGLTPADIVGVSDLPKLPLLTKELLRDRGAELQTSRKPRAGWLHGHTSGTTGSPVSLWYDRDTCIMTNGVDRRQKQWAGMQSGDWSGMLLGRVVVPTRQTRPPFWRVNHVQRQVWFSSFHMSEENLDSYVQEIARRRIPFLEGYPSTLFILARHVLDRGRSLPMRAVFTSSETLHSIQRETIEQAFQCRVHDFYGLAERVIFAAECDAHEGKHLAEEYGYTEIVDERGQPVPHGQAGYLVGTSLHNHAVPMLRYRTGDLSSIRREQCSCGRLLIRIADVATKAEDIVVTPDGRLISPSVLTHPFKPFDQLRKSQIIQDSINHVRVKLVPSSEFSQDHQRQLVQGLRERLGPDMIVEVEIVEDITREPSGKYRWVISRVDHSCKFSWHEAQ